MTTPNAANNQCEHGVEGGCVACRPCQCGCRLDKHYIRFESEPELPTAGFDGRPYTGCTIHGDCGGYLPRMSASYEV